ncbi:MAG: hypothetical protein KF764_13755 [Labilithrix sp.]|nr:hypothetical protein [Labilithrix sp.]MBX3225142.1 hypothetical protein [Labilithrix sp.]
MLFRARCALRPALVALAATTIGCGGGAPLLHPARTLKSGDVRAAGGVSAHVVPGSLGEDLRRAREIAAGDSAGTSSPGEPGTNPDYAKGALVAAAVAPGLAPFVGARVGVGNAFEGGLAYTGRGVRADMRRSFDDGPYSLSVGLGASAALYGRQQGSSLPNVDLGSLHGYGADVPVLFGWESQSGLYSLWLGPRAGFEWVAVETLTSEPKDVTIGSPPVRLEATRWHAGGVVGVATGFNHVHVALEAGVAYQIVNGTYNANDVGVRGLTITPASAIWWTF